jgi:hypothetical protein
MKKLASFGQEIPKQTMKTPATQQSTELIIRALQSNHFMQNPKPEIARMKDVVHHLVKKTKTKMMKTPTTPRKKKNTKLL